MFEISTQLNSKKKLNFYLFFLFKIKFEKNSKNLKNLKKKIKCYFRFIESKKKGKKKIFSQNKTKI